MEYYFKHMEKYFTPPLENRGRSISHNLYDMLLPVFYIFCTFFLISLSSLIVSSRPLSAPSMLSIPVSPS